MSVKDFLQLIGGVGLLIYGIKIMGDALQDLAGDRLRRLIAHLTGTPVRGVAVGALVTTIIQSSSATTVMVVSFVHAGLMTLYQGFGVIMGANIGTTITALLAATAISGAGAQLALTIALVHVLFNLFAVVLIYGVPFLRELPIRAAETLARVGSENKLLALGYVAGLFFALPALMMVAAK